MDENVKCSEKKVSASCTKFDEQLKEDKSLLRLPWVGKEYASVHAGKRLLIVGESHYNHLSSSKARINKDETRWMIHSNAIFFNTDGEGKRHKFLRTTEQVLFCKKLIISDNQKKLWNSVAFYNFVQKKMETKHHRPDKEDFNEGWLTFLKVVEVLEPDVVIFCGTSACGHLSKNSALFKSSNAFTWETIKSPRKKVNGTDIKDRYSLSNRNKITMITSFKHPSMACSYWKWGKILKEQFPDFFDWLRTEKSTGNVI